MVPETNVEHALSVVALALGVMSATYIIGALRRCSYAHSRLTRRAGRIGSIIEASYVQKSEAYAIMQQFE
jgi:hypothetical protein